MKKYEGFSLVEMLITIFIIGIVMLITSTTLTTLIKVSAVSNSKTVTRNETEFVLELIRRTVRNSNPSDVYIYNTSDTRTYNIETGEMEDQITEGEILEAYGTPVQEEGTEIQFRPYGFDSWVCIGYFPSSNTEEPFGYIIKATKTDLFGNQQTCFENDETREYIPLNSEYVNITGFDIGYTDSVTGNYIFTFDIDAEPAHWYLGSGAPIQKAVHRQAVVSTEGVTW